MKNILFVCSSNLQRSKTAEDYFSQINLDYNFTSAGTNLKICKKEGTNPLTIEILENAELIFVMENKHKKIILDNLKSHLKKEIIILNIPDLYKYYQKELIDILRIKIIPYLE